MAKKLIFTLILLGFLFGSVTDRCLADLSAKMDEALKCKRLQDFGRAEKIYQEIIADNPGSDAVAKAKIGLARMYKRTKRYDEAESLYKEVLADSVGVENAVTAQRYLTILYITKEEDAKAQASLNELKTAYPDCIELHRAAYHIARKYEFYKEYDKAANVYQYVVDNYPESSAAVGSRMGIPRINVLSLIDSDNDGAANIAIDKLMTDYAGYSYMPKALVQIGDAYQVNGDMVKAIAIWEKLIQQLPGSDMAAEADNLAGHGYRQLGQYAKSVECYQRIADNHPESRQAGHALFMVCRNYEQMGKEGLISKLQADSEVKKAYERLMRDYPNSKAARAGSRKLKNYSSK